MSTDSSVDEENQFVRINISLPKAFREKVHRLADEYAGGNTSHFIRDAVNNYEKSLDEDDRLTLELIRTELAGNTEKTDEVLSTLETLIVDTKNIDNQLDSGFQLVSPSGEDDDDADRFAREIRNNIAASDTPQAADDLLRSLSLRPMEVQAGIDRLVDYEIIEAVKDNGDATRYQLSDAGPNNPNHE